MGRPLLLLTRPEQQSRRLARAAQVRFPDLEIVISPLMQAVFLDAEIPAGTGLIFTSETAVAAYCKASADRDAVAWCVGPQTAAAAADAGFVTRTGPGTALELMQHIQAENPVGPLIWPHGKNIAFDIARGLNSAGIETVPVVLYRQDPVPLSDKAARALAGDAPVLVPVFSQRSARLLIPSLQGRTAPLYVAAISQNAADELRDVAPDRLCIAQTPDGDGVLEAIGQLLAQISAP